MDGALGPGMFSIARESKLSLAEKWSLDFAGEDVNSAYTRDHDEAITKIAGET